MLKQIFLGGILLAHFFIQEVKAHSTEFESHTTSSRLRSIAQAEISRTEWERQQLTSLTEVLQTLTSVQSAQGGSGQVAGVFVAGSAADQVLVLLDEMPLNDPTSPGGAFDFSRIPLSVLEKVEVIPQNEAVRYGFGALGGVILLTTRKSFVGGLAQFKVDHLGDRNLTIFFSDEKKSMLLSGAGAESLSSASESKGNTEKDFSSSQEVLLQSQLGAKTRKLSFLQTRQQFEFDKGPGENQDDPNSRTKNLLRLVRLEDEVQMKVGLIRPSLQWTQSQRQLDNPSDARFADSSFSLYQSQSLNFRSSLDLSSRERLVFLDYFAEFQQATFEESFNSSLLTDFKSDQWSDSVGATFGRSFSLRHFEFGFRQNLQGRDQKAAQFKVQTSLKNDSLFEVYIGTGVKVPTLYQRYSTYGSSDLRAEKSNSARVSLSKNEKGVSVFQTDYRDLIQFISSYQNIGKARIRGVSSWLDFDLTTTQRLKISAQYLDPQDLSSQKKLIQRSVWMGSAVYSLALRDESLFQVDAQLLGKADDQDAAGNFVERRSQVLLGASRSWLRQDLEYGVRLDNLLNQSESSVWGYSRPGLRLQGSFVMKF
jgi:vitamin B12 transporter